MEKRGVGLELTYSFAMRNVAGLRLPTCLLQSFALPKRSCFANLSINHNCVVVVFALITFVAKLCFALTSCVVSRKVCNVRSDKHKSDVGQLFTHRVTDAHRILSSSYT